MEEETGDTDGFSQGLLLKLYQEHSTWSRHQESQRSTTSNLILTISSILIGVITIDGELNKGDLFPSLLVFFLGIFGMVFSYKYYVQFLYHDARVNCYKKKLEEITSVVVKDIFLLERESDKVGRNRFRIFSRLGLYQLWICLNLIIAAIGFLLIFFSTK